MKLKGNKGIGLTDAIIAIAIFIIFSGVIISISYNIYLQSNFVKRNSTATNYIVNLFEYAKGQNIETINYNNLRSYILTNYGENNITIISSGELNDADIGRGYTIQISVTDMNSIEPTQYEENFVKRIDITVYYKLGRTIKNVTMSTLINK